ncbi:hypothetical protein KCP69_00330 [Salmonella enterica subsp. enterica]|nr:hypothetical protein KCP69_00330 [Salmonella enterica subsp. enterica]
MQGGKPGAVITPGGGAHCDSESLSSPRSWCVICLRCWNWRYSISI